MPTLEDVKEQIKHLDGASKLLAFREIRELPKLLWEDERIEKLVQGFYVHGQGILVATNKRILFVDKGLIYGIRVEDFAYDRITSIEYHTGMVFGKIILYVAGNRAEISQVDKTLVGDFANYVRNRIASSSAHVGTTAPQPTSSPAENRDFIARLERLADLKERGVLTEEEFQIQKQRILNS